MQYQEGHCVQASLSIVVCICLAWLSPLYQERPSAERGERFIRWICSVCVSVFMSLAACLGVSAGTNTDYQ